MCKKSICWALVLAIGLSVVARAELVGYWKLNEGKGTTFLDETDYWTDGTIAPWDATRVKWSTAGHDANCLDFVSATGPFPMCDAPVKAGLLDIKEATVSFWMNMPASFQAWGPILVLLGQGADHSVECDGAADLFIADFGTDTYGDLKTSGAKLNDGKWRHVAITYSATAKTMTVYVDGLAKSSQAFTSSDPVTAVRIGGPRSRTQWRRYLGRLDDVAVWNHALSAADIKNVFWFGPQWLRFATGADPANESTVGTTNVTLRWTAGQTAVQHHVYLGTNADDVKNGTAGTDQGLMTKTSFSSYTWALGQTYYWRVDEIEKDGTTYAGVVWSFTVSAKLSSLPAPKNGTVLVDPNVTLSWTPGSGATTHSVYLGTDPASLPAVASKQTKTTYGPVQLAAGTTYYWRVDESDGANTYPGDLWHFKTRPDIPVTDPNLVGYWSFDQDEIGIAVDGSGHGRDGQILGEPNHVEGYNAQALAFDGVNDRVEVPQVVSTDLTLMAWIKAQVPGAAGATARDGSGLLWSDHAGGGDHFTLAVLGTKLAFETGPGGNPNTTSMRDVVTGEWVHVAVTRVETSRQVQLFINGTLDATGDHTGDRNVGSNPLIVIGGNVLDSRFFKGLIDEVRAYNRVLTAEQIVAAARGNLLLAWNPSPGPGAVIDVHYDQPLTWSAGDKAVQHDVYFGTDKAAVQAATPKTAGVYQGQQEQTAFSPKSALQWDTTYYWRIDEVQADGTVTPGKVWSFKIANYLIVDDFESYVDVEGKAIFDTWLDGYGTTTNGSQVGYSQSPFAERTIVHGGRQSMPLNYNDTGAIAVSEAERTWETPQDWTIHGLNTLTLSVRGRTENSSVRLYVTVKDSTGRSATVANANANAVTTASWQDWSIPFTALTPVDLSKVSAMTIGLGDPTKVTGGTGLIFIDDIQVRTAK